MFDTPALEGTAVIALPLDPKLTLIVMSEPRPQVKNQETGEISIDRDTNQRAYSMDVAMSVPGGRPVTFQMTVPEGGLVDVVVFQPIHAVGLTYMTGEKNGRTWQIFRAAGITPLGTQTATNQAV